MWSLTSEKVDSYMKTNIKIYVSSSGLTCKLEVSLRSSGGHKGNNVLHLSCFKSHLRENEGWPTLQTVSCSAGGSRVGKGIPCLETSWWLRMNYGRR